MGLKQSSCIEDSCICANDEPYSKVIYEASPCVSPVLTYDSAYNHVNDNDPNKNIVAHLVMKPFSAEENPLSRKIDPRQSIECQQNEEKNSEAILSGDATVTTQATENSTQDSR